MLELVDDSQPSSPTETDDAMTDERRDDRRSDSPGRRDSDQNFVGHVRAADTGMSFVVKWANVIVTIVCFGFMLGVQYASTNAMKEKFDELSKKVTASQQTTTELDKAVALLKKDAEINKRDNDRITAENAELRAILSEMRGMREAYVYDFGKQAMQGKIPKTVPP